MTAPVIAAVLRKEREIADAFRRADATAPSRAITLVDAGVTDGIGLRRLRRRAAIRESGPGRFYLDEGVYAALRSVRRRIAIIVLLLAAVAILVGVITIH